MATLITDPDLEQQVRATRSEWGGDRYDEVWEGMHVMTPVPNIEHQDIAGGLVTVLRVVIDWTGMGKVYPGINVSDRELGWKKNYRVPDAVVVLNGTKARHCGTHLCGGPDFLAEIVSPHDLSRDKLQFYAGINVRELLIIDRDPWCLELYRLDAGNLGLVGRSTLDEPNELRSDVIPLSFSLLAGSARPQIEVVHHDGRQQWVV